MKTGPAGWYGKIASLGDFAHRRLPPGWIARCDAWLSGALPVARSTLGERWLDVYLTAPVLRFAWSPGVVDRHWWVGVLMASCDNVGRYFPLVIAQELSEAPDDRAALHELDDWYAHLTQIAMDTLDDRRGSLAGLEAALTAVTLPPLPGQRHPAPTSPSSPPVDPSSLGAAAEQTIALTDVTDRSLWWIAASPGDERIDVVEGLPDGVRFASLLMKSGSVEADLIDR